VKTPYGPALNAFVYVKSGLEGRSFGVPAEPVVLDQRSYEFIPHVFGVRVGQPLRITSGDPTLHNVRCTPFENPEFNETLAMNESRTKVFRAPEVMIEIRCDLHPNMKAYVGVVDHPFFAVTGPDGAFEFRGLPPGEYTIGAWAEGRGLRSGRISLRPPETGTLTLVYD
jgi:plastocyanin